MLWDDLKSSPYLACITCAAVFMLVASQDVWTVAGPLQAGYTPLGIALDSSTNSLFFSDSNWNTVYRLFLTNGTVVNVAGCECWDYRLQDGPATTARFRYPAGLVLSAGTLYVADAGNHAIRSINIDTRSVVTLAGAAGMYGYQDGIGRSALFCDPMSLALLSSASLMYVADTSNYAIRRINMTNLNVTTVTTFPSTTQTPFSLSLSDSATLYVLMGYYTDFSGGINWLSYYLLQLNLTSGQSKNASQTYARAASTNAPSIAFDVTSQTMYETFGRGLARISLNSSANGTAVIAGNLSDSFTVPFAWSARDGVGSAARFGFPANIALTDPGDLLYVADASYLPIRQVVLANQSVTSLLQWPQCGLVDGLGSTARFSSPRGLAFDVTSGMLYVADCGNNALRGVATSNFNVSTLAGSSGSESGYADASIGSQARFSCPMQVVVDASAGLLYVSDYYNHAIRALNLNSATHGVVTLVGTNTSGFADGVGSTARFYLPTGLALDTVTRILYVADAGNKGIRKVSLRDATVTTIAVFPTLDIYNSTPINSLAYDSLNGVLYFSMDAVYGVFINNASYFMLVPQTSVANPRGLLLDSRGLFAVASNSLSALNGVVIKVVNLSSGAVTTLAGSFRGFNDGIGNNAKFSSLWGMAINATASRLFVSDNNSIRIVATVACPAGASIDANHTCANCSAGTYATSANQLTCTLCNAGTYSNVVGRTTSCPSCPRGTYNPFQGQVACIFCPPGSWTSSTGATSITLCNASLCLSGSYCPGNGSMISCPQGSCNSLSGQNSSLACTLCGPGTYAATAGQALCTPCSAGTYSPDVGRSTSCIPCTPGTTTPFTAQTNRTSCVPCDPGWWSVTGLCRTDLCVAGYYCPGNISMLPCPTGTYSLVSGMSSAAQCTACSPGTSNPSPGASTASACQVCPLGYYGPGAGLSSCVACAVGYFSPITGAITCQSCSGAYYSNVSGSGRCSLCPAGTYGSVVSVAQAGCMLCPPGTFSATVGRVECSRCAAGFAQGLAGQSACTPCSPGTYAASEGQDRCLPCEPHTSSNATSLSNATGCPACPTGEYQPLPGQTKCLACANSMSLFPTLDPAPVIVAASCAPMSQTLTLNWGAYTASQINPIVTVVPADGGTVPSWLAINVVGATYITFSSVEVPLDVDISVSVPGAQRSSTRMYNISVAHLCRTHLFMVQVPLTVTVTLPSFVNSSTTANACPDFTVQLVLAMGSCASHLTTYALMFNGTTLVPAPWYVQLSLSSGAVTLFGTVPSSDSVLKMVVVATLFGITAAQSSPFLVTRLNGDILNAPIFATPDALTIRACPSVQITLRVQPAPCGQTVLSAAAVVAGSLMTLPSYLYALQLDSRTLTVSGVIPEGVARITIVGTATVIGTSQRVYNSSPIEIFRPPTAATVNLTLSAVNRVLWTTNSVLKDTVEATYGVAIQIFAAMTFSSGDTCESASIRVVASLENDTDVTGQSALPPWLVLVSTNRALTISGTLTKDVASTSWSFCVSVANGGTNAAICLGVLAKASLTIAQRNVSLLAEIITPSPLVSLSLQLPPAALEESFVCPTTSDEVAAICNFNSVTRTLGAFGTADGVNVMLRKLQLATTRTNVTPSMLSQLGNASVTVSDTINPQSIVLQLSITNMKVYEGVTLVSSIPQVQALVGIEASIDLPPYFSSPNTMTYTILGERGFLQLDGWTLKGTPSSIGLFVATVEVSDKLTSRAVNVTFLVKNPLPPQLVSNTLWRVVIASSDTLNFAFPPSAFVDPQGGDLSFDARVQSAPNGGLKPLPDYLQFDAQTLLFRGIPQPSDVGELTVRIIATKQYGPWQGNVSATLTIAVTLSWQDFFAAVYTYAGFGLSALSVLTAILVYRSWLRNVLSSQSWCLETPSSLSIANGGSHTLRNKFSDIQRISLTPLSHVSSNTSKFPVFLQLQWAKHSDLPSTEGMDGGLYVPWVKLRYHRNERVELVIDEAVLRQQLRDGETLGSDVFLVEVSSRGLWSNGFLLEAFTFSVSDVLSVSLLDSIASLPLPQAPMDLVLLPSNESNADGRFDVKDDAPKESAVDCPTVDEIRVQPMLICEEEALCML